MKHVPSLVAFALCAIGCGLTYPAMPTHPADSSEELKYIYRTDQKDRRRVLGKIIRMNNDELLEDAKILQVSDRDSFRLARVIELSAQGLVRSDADKFHAASIYDHEGGLKMAADSTYFRIAYELFKELNDKGYRRGMTRSLMATSYQRWKDEGATPR
jgi:hypothetical protein